MKKITWALLGFLMLFTACSSEEEYAKTDLSGSLAVGDNHFYGVKVPEIPETTRGVAQRSKLWHPSANIKVKFLNGTSSFQNKVKTYAKVWEQYMSVRFEFVTSGNADVRVGFDWNDERYVTWSYIGTDCKFVTNQSEATMSFAYFDSMTDREIKADVLRAFGQVLGLELEHRHLNFNAGWKTQVSNYWEGEIEDIPWASLKQYVFDPLLSTDVIQTDAYDPNSIMIWPFTARYASNTARERNYDLSAKDIEFIRSLYPIIEDGVAIMMRVSIDEDSPDYLFWISVNNSNNITIDWGDGTVEEIKPEFNKYMSNAYTASSWHGYKPNKDYVIKIYANPLSVIGVTQDSGPNTSSVISQLDISKCVNIQEFMTERISVSELDFSKFTKLKNLYLVGSFAKVNLTKNLLLEELLIRSDYLTLLDISKNTLLKTLEIQGKLINSLDVTKNTSLEILSTSFTSISNLDLSKNTKLITLNSSLSTLDRLDITKNVLLQNLYLYNTSISSLDVTKNTKLLYVSLFNTPLESNIAALTNFAKSLPTITSGTAILSLNKNGDKIASILQSKNWRYN